MKKNIKKKPAVSGDEDIDDLSILIEKGVEIIGCSTCKTRVEGKKLRKKTEKKR